MTFLQLQQKVAGWLSRDTDDFTANTFNNLQQTINDAITMAQRLVDFNLLLKRGYLPMTNNVGDWTTALLSGLGGSSVTAKKLHSVYGSDEDYVYKIPMRTEDDMDIFGPKGGEYAYLEGTNLYYKNSTETISGVYVKYFQKLAALSADGDNNVLTNNIGDWIALQAAFEMLHYIKEDERVELSAGLLRYKWDSVIAWNESFRSEQDLSLD